MLVPRASILVALMLAISVPLGIDFIGLVSLADALVLALVAAQIAVAAAYVVFY